VICPRAERIKPATCNIVAASVHEINVFDSVIRVIKDCAARQRNVLQAWKHAFIFFGG